jgi:ParB family transcriptional regulator, chromosome partitioning protein
MAGLTEVPALVRDLTDREALELALVENLQREDLSPVEEARGYQALLSMGLTQEEVAKRVGKARSTVANALRLLQLPEEVLRALEAGEITAGHARALLMLEPEDRLWGLKEILEKGLSVRQAEALRERLGREKRSKEPSPLSLELSRHLGLPVKVLGRRRGRVVIHYRSLEELEALLERLGYQA